MTETAEASRKASGISRTAAKTLTSAGLYGLVETDARAFELAEKNRAQWVKNLSVGDLPGSLSLREIQTEVLDPDTLLLEYSLGDSKSFLWAVSRTSIHTYQLPPRCVIEAAAIRAHRLLAKGYARATKVELAIALAELSRMVLAPAKEQMEAQRLAIVSDGALDLVPFSVLPDPRTQTVQPLLARYEIVNLPSASSLRLLRQRAESRKATRQIAVLADPVFSSRDPRAPEGSPTGSFERLSSTRQEAEAILSLVAPGQGLAAFGFEASRRTVLAGRLKDYRFIHFATHGLMTPGHSASSGLLLSTMDEMGRPQEGFLRASEVWNLDLPADLVTLSACETALTPHGGNTASLAQGFLKAGARRVLVSYWNVSDRATTHLMSDFYRRMLINRLSPAKALRQAQEAMRAELPWSSPYYWASFSLQGDWR